MKPPTGADAERLRALLDELGGEIEQLLMGGMTTASKATRDKLDVAFREASRRRLSRLAVSLRVVIQEVGHYVAKDPRFSPRRLSMFCNRVWVLARGMRASMASGNTERFAQLALDRREEPVDQLRAVTLGVMQKRLPGVCAFDFHMRLLDEDKIGAPAVYSLVFPLKKGSQIPPEAMLELDQPQKWKPRILLQGRVITFRNPTLVHGTSGLRIQTPRSNPESKAEAGDPFTGWSQLAAWDPGRALERVEAHQVDPLEIPNELQEEVVLDDWRLSGPREDEARARQVYPVHAAGLEFDGIASSEDEGRMLRDNLRRILDGELPVGPGPGAPATRPTPPARSRNKSAKKSTKKSAKKGTKGTKKGAKKAADEAAAVEPPAPSSSLDPRAGRLFGVVHYETCRFVLQPLALITERGPIQLMLQSEGVDKKALLRSLSF